MLLQSKLWEELQEQDYITFIEFYRKVGKHFQIESSKEALYKSQDMKSGKTEEKREAKKRKSGRRKDKSLKKLQIKNNKMENGYVTRYTNYSPLNAPVGHIFTATRDKAICKEPDVIK